MSKKVKLDENFSSALADLFAHAGFDAHSVLSEDLSGATDLTIYETICAERRILITFDTDFCNILRFPPENTEGIVVIRPNRPINLATIRILALQAMEQLVLRESKGCLWVLEPNKLRIRRPIE
jgi:predicted nuclease of predicted toxin-antitoxin system